MPRKKKLEVSAGVRGVSRSRRSKERREKRKAETAVNDHRWLISIRSKMDAMRILNDDKTRPYWLSIPHEKDSSPIPQPSFFPVEYLRVGNRIYYGFLFREHREEQVALWEDARRELSERALNLTRK